MAIKTIRVIESVERPEQLDCARRYLKQFLNIAWGMVDPWGNRVDWSRMHTLATELKGTLDKKYDQYGIKIN